MQDSKFSRSVTMMITVFFDVMRYILVEGVERHESFRGTYCRHIQERRTFDVRRIFLLGIGIFPQDHVTTHPRRQQTSHRNHVLCSLMLTLTLTSFHTVNACHLSKI